LLKIGLVVNKYARCLAFRGKLRNWELELEERMKGIDY
jgi:hypothetical protein